MLRLTAVVASTLTALALVACGTASSGPDPGVGVAPQLPPPTSSLVPRVEVADAVGWPAGATPKAPAGLAVKAFATGLDHPRWVYVLPNGDVLVAETNAPPRPDDGKGIKGFFMKLFMKKAGSATPSANRITLLRDADGDGVAETRHAFITGLNSPFGMALVGDTLYIANTDAVVKVPYRTGSTSIAQAPVKVTDLPAGTINHHWTKNLIANRDGTKLYVTVGSNSNVAENGMEVEHDRAAILEVDVASGNRRLFASGLRNPNGLAWHPESGVLWTVVNERDELGNDLVPDYLTSVQEGSFYGWPYSYFGSHVDTRVKPPRPDLVARAVVPDYALGSHVAPLGLAFYDAQLLPQRYRNGAFVGEHGSWNRKPKSGYKVVFVAFTNGRPTGMPEDVMTGFLDDAGNARGRPVGVAVDKAGALLVADDVGNAVWRMAPAGG
jgi:glucose/arabinose dehydrogenase